jgi:acyl-CoA synthetase (AMP-forming)/AMP-acid ligase II
VIDPGATGAVLQWAEDGLLTDSARAALTGPGAPFEMAEEDVLGAKMAVFVRRPRTMRQVLEGAADRFGDQPFLIFPDRTYTYRSIHQPVASVAAVLQDRFGVGPGDRVAIVSANIPGHAITAWAAVSLGAVVVELNGWWTGPELVHGLELTRPKVVFGDRRRLDRLPAGSVDIPAVCFEDDFDAMEAGDARSLPADPAAEDDPLCILFTSGTTGRPKGAMLSHRNHVNMMMQAALQGQIGAMLEPASSEPADQAGPACSIGVSPMFHISGFSVALIGGPLIGAQIAYPPPGRWDPEVQMEMTERFQAAAWSVVPTQLWRLLEHPRFDDFDLSSLRRVGGGGSTFQPELWRQVREPIRTASPQSSTPKRSGRPCPVTASPFVIPMVDRWAKARRGRSTCEALPTSSATGIIRTRPAPRSIPTAGTGPKSSATSKAACCIWTGGDPI